MNELNCNEFVELVSGFLDHDLDADTHRRAAEHLEECGGCARYLEQFELTVRTLGELRSGDDAAPPPGSGAGERLPDDARAALLEAFRDRR